MLHLDEARTEAIEFGLVPNRPNIRRVVRAHDLVNRGLVRHQATFENDSIYLVMSQNNPSQIYTVLKNGKIQCNCPDAQKNDVSLCKHSLSVILAEEKAREDAMIAEYEAYESNRFACDGYELY